MVPPVTEEWTLRMGLPVSLLSKKTQLYFFFFFFASKDISVTLGLREPPADG